MPKSGAGVQSLTWRCLSRKKEKNQKRRCHKLGRYPSLSAQEREAIKELRASNLLLTGYEIAAIIGRSKSVVFKYIRAKSVPNWTDEEMSVLTDGYLRNKSASSIANDLKRRSKQAIRIKMHRHKKEVGSSAEIKSAVRLLGIAFAAGLSPEMAIEKIRDCDAFARLKMERGIK